MTKEILKEQKNRDYLNKKWVESGRIANSLEHIKIYKTIVPKKRYNLGRKNLVSSKNHCE